MSTDIRLVVSDFGNVIATFDYRIFCDALGRRIGRSGEDVFTQLFTGDLQQRFEHGALSGPTYHREAMGRLGAQVPYEEFFGLYGNIFTEIPETVALLQRLHARYPLYLLSDTNEIHLGYVQRTVPVLQLFDGIVVSCAVGCMKPDPRIYQEVLRRANLPAGACVFFDDRLGNVEGARRVGMHGILFESPSQCAAELERLGVQTR